MDDVTEYGTRRGGSRKPRVATASTRRSVRLADRVVEIRASMVGTVLLIAVSVPWSSDRTDRDSLLFWWQEVVAMQAQVGARLLFHGKKVGSADHTAEVIEVRGVNGAPPYVVRFDDGHETLIFPGTDCQVLHGDDPPAGTRET
jgi:hypothetical protein